MQFKKKKSIFLLTYIILLFFVVLLIINRTYSTKESVSDEYLVNNVNILNDDLKNVFDIHNTYYLDEILDDTGNVPAYNYYTHIKSRTIKELKAYDGKIFMGLGDWNDNTGPVKILYYDTVDGKIKSSGTISDEAVEGFYIINDNLYTTGTDPRANWGYGSYYVYNKENNNWEQHKFNDGWIHVFEIEKYHDKLFMCGSTVDSTQRSPVQVSYDNGQTFQDVKLVHNGQQLPYHSNLRFYAFETFNDKFYAYTYSSVEDYKYNGIYIYDEANNQFNFVRTISYGTRTYGVGLSINFNYVRFKNNRVFNDKFVFVSGDYMYSFEGEMLQKSSKIDFNTPDAVQDIVVVDDTLYTLSYQVMEDNSIDVRIYKTKDLENFTLVYEFNSETFPYSIEYYDNYFYIGTGHNAKSDKAGSLYKLDANKLKKSLSLDRTNKVINVTDDGITYPVNYTLNSNNVEFKTKLSFDNSMSQEEWEQEFLKLESLNLLYTLADTKKYVDYNNSTLYYNNAIDDIIVLNDNYSNALEFASSVFSEQINIEDRRFRLATRNINDIEDKYEVEVILTVFDIDDKITSDVYKVDNDSNYIYIGADNDINLIRNNINVSDIVSYDINLDDNKVYVKYYEKILREYVIVRFNTAKEIVSNYLYVSNLNDDEVTSLIEVINGDKVIYENKLQIKYNDAVLEEYKLIRISSNQLPIINNTKLYIDTKNVSEIEDYIDIINGNININNNKIEILFENSVVGELDILTLNLGTFIEIEHGIIIPRNYSYNDFVNHISVSDGLSMKVFNDTEEVIDGYIEENMVFEIYCDTIKVDKFNIKEEFLKFNNIEVDEENKYLLNVNKNTNVSEFIKNINTSGNISVTNNKGEMIENLVGTGSKINIQFIEEKITYQVIVNGDIDGNGLINLQDIMKIAKYVYNNKNVLDGIYLKAADYDTNGLYDLRDIMKIAYSIYKSVTK